MGSARERQAKIAEGALVSFVQPNQSPLREQYSQLAPQTVKRKKENKVGHIKAADTGLEGFVDWVDPTSSEPTEGRKNDMFNFVVGYALWIRPQAKGCR